MQHRHTIIAMLLGGVLLLAACTKENLSGLPEGAIRLTAEGFVPDGSKVSVQDNTVIWEDGDVVRMGGDNATVHVSNGVAWISSSGMLSNNNVVNFLYPSYIAYSGNIGDNATANLPAIYTSDRNYMVGSRQHITLPMGAHYDRSVNPTRILFRHISAAVKVMLWNDMGYDLVIDTVRVNTETYCINGNVSLNLADDNLGVVTAILSNDARHTVAVAFPPSGDGALVVPDGDQSKSVQVPIRPIGDDNITIRVYGHKVGSSEVVELYSHTANSPALFRNNMLTAKVKLVERPRRTVTLGTLGTSYTAQNGDKLTGTAGQNTEIKIAAGATVFLDNVNIVVPDDDVHRYSALKCEGDATIILMGTNTLTGGHYATGLQAGPSGTTLTIKGDGTLTATGRDGGGAGIGGISTGIEGYNMDCGNIKIAGGTIKAYGGSFCAGIGGTNTKNCGNITITGGNVTAYGGRFAAGIGSSNGGTTVASQCGNITISGGTVYAKGGALAAGIGCGASGRCGYINITINVTRVEAVKGDNIDNNSAPCSIGKAFGGNGYPNSSSGLITIGGTNYNGNYGVTTSPFIYEP